MRRSRSKGTRPQEIARRGDCGAWSEQRLRQFTCQLATRPEEHQQHDADGNARPTKLPRLPPDQEEIVLLAAKRQRVMTESLLGVPIFGEETTTPRDAVKTRVNASQP